MSHDKKRVLIAGSQPQALMYGRALKQEGFEFSHTVNERDSRIEWMMGGFCAAIILEEGLLLSLTSSSPELLKTNLQRPLIYMANKMPPELVRTELPIFGVKANETEVMLVELLRALLRRKAGYPKESRYDGFGVDHTKRKISFNGNPLPLSLKQFSLLNEFVFSAGKLLDQNYLHHQLWPGKDFDRNRLAAHISLLRRTFKSKHIPMLILNHKGKGYVMKPKIKHQLRPTRGNPKLDDLAWN